ncbi:hypothetical protein [Deinococcus gobiensis]|uniref:Uncharacterized protein n=1 Tax=Deinococcus gobiensis (strain DSM 21396 / JCM 16679 / CGMCC 1.7299 / I-0) TaxID=745776 RepID=H8H1L6_DEIGI|nr:hypothetical protein [Deinococcus gobiensis]AFD27413.1 hypothetical protein DGo_PB0144 [Deinococcus gobiensis I-0]
MSTTYHEATLGSYDTRFVAWAEGEHLLISARHATDAERPVPGCALNDDQARQLLAHLHSGLRFSLEGVSGAVELFAWGNIHLQNSAVEGRAALGMTSYDLRGGHAGLAQLMRRAMKDRTLPENT